MELSNQRKGVMHNGQTVRVHCGRETFPRKGTITNVTPQGCIVDISGKGSIFFQSKKVRRGSCYTSGGYSFEVPRDVN